MPAKKKSTRGENPLAICNLNVAERLAVAKAKDLDVTAIERDTLIAGAYPVDCIVHVKGTLEVGADCETVQVNKLKPWRLLALALDKLNGVTIESLVRECDGVWDPKAEEEPAEVKAATERAQKALDELRGKVKSPRKGTVKFDGVITRTHETDGSVQVFEGDGTPATPTPAKV